MKAFHSMRWNLHSVPSKWPVSMTTPPSIHLRVLAAKWEKSPEPEIPLTRSTPAGGRPLKHHVRFQRCGARKASFHRGLSRIAQNTPQLQPMGFIPLVRLSCLRSTIKLQLKTGWILYEKMSMCQCLHSSTRATGTSAFQSLNIVNSYSLVSALCFDRWWAPSQPAEGRLSQFSADFQHTHCSRWEKVSGAMLSFPFAKSTSAAMQFLMVIVAHLPLKFFCCFLNNGSFRVRQQQAFHF